MDVNLVGLDRTLNVHTGEESCGVTLRLPDGNLFRALVEDEVATHIRAMLAQAPAEPAPVCPPQALKARVSPVPHPEPELPPSKDDGIFWSRLPDNVVSATMKESLRVFGIEEPLAMGALQMAMEDINRLVSSQAQANLDNTVNKVQWGDVPPADAPRKVPICFQNKDSAGYPCNPPPRQLVADPGEVADDVDEDGVGQL